MRAIFMAKQKQSSVNAIKFLLKNNINVPFAVIQEGDNQITKVCRKNNINIVTDIELYELIEKKDPKLNNIDIVISFLYWKIIKKPLINLGKIGCINFHPAPLPDYRGVGGYNYAILDELDYWGISAHFVDENIDTGDIIKVNKFDIPIDINVLQLEKMSQKKLVKLFKDVMTKIINGVKIVSYKQDLNKGKYISKKRMEKAKKVSLNDTSDEIDKKIRAFWFPPYHGANIIIDGKKYTLVNKKILEYISNKNEEISK